MKKTFEQLMNQIGDAVIQFQMEYHADPNIIILHPATYYAVEVEMYRYVGPPSIFGKPLTIQNLTIFRSYEDVREGEVIVGLRLVRK